MFSGIMVNAWIVATMVAVVAGVVGFFTVLRGSAFVAHAVPQAGFAGAAGASLIGVSTLAGLGTFAVMSALSIGFLGKRGRHDAVTALALVFMLGLGALFLSWSDQYASATYALLFGEVLGVANNQVLATAVLGVVCILAVVTLYRPLLLSSVMPEVAEARGVRTQRMELCFLVVVALVTTMSVPVVGALLMFSLMIGSSWYRPLLYRQATGRPESVGRLRGDHRLDSHRGFLPDRLARRVLRRGSRRGLLRCRPGLGCVAAFRCPAGTEDTRPRDPPTSRGPTERASSRPNVSRSGDSAHCPRGRKPPVGRGGPALHAPATGARGDIGGGRQAAHDS